ncbi:hypothetical protein tloyanaT_22920 [Thalassotalea loyana]|uniref:SPOR domain-containing protein n=1 Tax=Thalassotalea loyana TaxID=280483 RepID=A0ABQ6HDJ1_9GAMM|nr:SPOR domain-containing protein [Thalassotalea loyana]GLX86039.1 hypothetical protein tloyanaT_22920 [Thalassotalea loyana]
MKKYLYPLIATIIPSSLLANEHQVYLLSSYNYQSASDVGFNAGYQYFFKPNFAFQVGVDQSGELEKETNTGTLYGEFESLYLGATMQKPFNDKITSFASAGVMYVTDTTNEEFLASESTLPYLGLGFNFALTNNFAVTLKHQSQFGNDAYRDMHSINFGITFKFGTENKITAKRKATTKPEQTQQSNIVNASINKNDNSVVNAPVVATAKSESNDMDVVNSGESIVYQQWHIQLGVFSNDENAKLFVKEIEEKIGLLDNHKLSIRPDKNVYRVIIDNFEDKASAKKWQLDTLTVNGIDGYVVQDSKKD